MRIYTEYNEKLTKDNDSWLNQIVKIDEIQIFMNIPLRKQLPKLGQKRSELRHMGKKKLMLLQLLWVFAKCTKLSLMFVFKDTSWGIVKKNYRVHFDQRNKGICILPTKGLEKWVNNKIMNIWSLEKILSLWNSKGFYACDWWYINA